MEISSIVEKIRKVEFVAPKGSRPMKAARVAKMGTGYSDNLIIVELANGQYIAARAMYDKKGICVGFNDERIFDALICLGKITETEKKAHMDYEKKVQENRQKKYDLDDLEKMAEKYNFKLTAEQRAKLKKD